MDGEFVLGTPVVRAFVAHVQTTVATAGSPADACDAIRPRFADLIVDPDWLPLEYQAAAPESGMGGGIGQWLLYRADDGSLSLFSLVVPAGSETPVHDHLAWGLVGLYRGEQAEIYVQRDGVVELVEAWSVRPGDFYALIPPRDDIRRVADDVGRHVRLQSHLLTNDTGCVWRHAFDPVSGEATPFRSGYVNVACEHLAPPALVWSGVCDAAGAGILLVNRGFAGGTGFGGCATHRTAGDDDTVRHLRP